jgi:hypothetical protein
LYLDASGKPWSVKGAAPATPAKPTVQASQ